MASRASPEDILGVSADVSAEMLGLAEQRLLDRYDNILGSVNVPDDIAELARHLRTVTQETARKLHGRISVQAIAEGRVASDYRSGQHQSREEGLLARGARLIEAQDWAQADHLLSEAMRINPSHPGILTALAWARYNNAGLTRPDREAKARQLLQQVVEQSPRFAEAHYCLARLYVDAGNLLAARSAVSHAVRLAPDEVRYAKLQERI